MVSGKKFYESEKKETREKIAKNHRPEGGFTLKLKPALGLGFFRRSLQVGEMHNKGTSHLSKRGDR